MIIRIVQVSAVPIHNCQLTTPERTRKPSTYKDLAPQILLTKPGKSWRSSVAINKDNRLIETSRDGESSCEISNFYIIEQ